MAARPLLRQGGSKTSFTRHSTGKRSGSG